MADVRPLPPLPASYRPDPAFASLHTAHPGRLADPVAAAEFPAARIRFRNDRWAAAVGLGDLSDADWVRHFARFAPLPDNQPEPLALRYHGHQFGVYNPEIGDGRGFLFAQLRDRHGRLLDLGTKGSGQTPYSRFGDGRLTLKGAVREVLATEMLEALGVETSKTFSMVETGEELVRGDEPSPTRSAVLVRLQHSHIRIGAFQRLATEHDGATMAALARYCLDRYFGGAGGASESDAAVRLHAHAVAAVARQVAGYMAAGFVHGVLNSDNIAITGESFDYGPWRFAESWDPGFTAAYFDQTGLYAFGRQPEAMHWNLGQLAMALRLIAPAEPLIEQHRRFPELYARELAAALRWRLGFAGRGDEADMALAETLVKALRETRVPLATFYHDWMGRPADPPPGYDGEVWAAFREAAAAQGVARPRGDRWDGPPVAMLIDEVEAIWAAIAERDDWAPFEAKVAAIRRMGAALA